MGKILSKKFKVWRCPDCGANIGLFGFLLIKIIPCSWLFGPLGCGRIMPENISEGQRDDWYDA